MFNLTKEEKSVLVFLVACFIIGTGVNFYKKRFDGMRPKMESFSENALREKEAKVNINSATFNELIKLKGIGKKTASRIIDYRKKNGPFFYREDIMRVKGIGRAKFDIIKDCIIIE